MSLVKNLAGQTLIYGLGHILPRILHFVVFNSYLTYKWNDQPIEYAVYLDLYAYASVLLVVFSFRMDTAMFRFGKDPEKLEKTYVTALASLILTSIAFILAAFAFSGGLADLLTYPDKGHYVKWFALIIGFDVISLLPYARYRLINRAVTFIKFKIANVVLTVVLVFIFLELLPLWAPELLERTTFVESEVDLVFLSNLIASFVIMVVILGANLPKTWQVDWGLWRTMLKYAWPLIIVGVAGSINQFFAVPLQKYFLGDAVQINKEQAAIYGAVQKLAALLAMFTTAYNYAAEPFFFRNMDRRDAKSLYGDVALFFVIAAGMLALGIFLFKDVFQWIIGPHFRSGLYLLPILLMAYVFLGIYYNVSIWYKLGDKTLVGAGIATLGSAITLGVSIVFLPVYGMVASAWAALACYSVMVIAAYWLGQKYYPIAYPVKRIMTYLTAIAVLMATAMVLQTGKSAMDLATGVVLWLLFAGFAYRMDREKIHRYWLS